MNNTFDPVTLANDLYQVERVYARFFASLDESRWDKPVKGGSKEWTLHETVAHLCALTGAGVQCIKHTLRGEPYTFKGLESRYDLNAYNRKGIGEHLDIPMKALCAELLGILDESASIAHSLQASQAELTAPMAIYNRPVTIFEALSIIMVHAGLFHSAQVAEPVGLPPLWRQFSPEIHHRLVGRTMNAFSLLYRFDIGGSLHDTLVFRIDGPGGGEWYVEVSPQAATSGEGTVEHPGLVIHLRETAVFCQMLTGRLKLPIALSTGRLKLHGDLRLFLRMNTLFSVDARPRGIAATESSSNPQHQTGEIIQTQKEMTHEQSI